MTKIIKIFLIESLYLRCEKDNSTFSIVYVIQTRSSGFGLYN